MTNLQDVKSIFKVIFPEHSFEIVDVSEGMAKIVMPEKRAFLRPGNSIAGPVLMMMADSVVYAAILGKFGEQGMHYVTSNLNINFLARAQPGEIVAKARLLKAGSRQVSADVEMFDHRDVMVAKAMVSYMAVASAR